MKVAFWSNGNGRNGVTGNMIATSLMMTMQHQYKTVMMQSKFDLNSLDYAFLDYSKNQMIRERFLYYPNKGIDYFLKKCKLNEINPMVISQGAEKLIESAYYIPTTMRASKEIFEESMLHSIQGMLETMDKFADITFIDVGNGMSELIRKVLQEVDLIVVNIVQDTRGIEHFFQQYQEYMSKSVFLISFYNYHSNFNLKNIQRIYRIDKKNIGVIPYNVLFHDALCSGKSVKYLTNNFKCKNFDKNYYFIKEIKSASDMILQRMGMNEALF